MRISVIVATRNRGHLIESCLDSIKGSIDNAGNAKCELILVDNGSTDDTKSIVGAWSAKHGLPVKVIFEPIPGLSRAQNAAIDESRGDILVFTDDDCQMDDQYITNASNYFSQRTEDVIVGGRVELGDELDLPITIFTHGSPEHWRLRDRASSKFGISGSINGCNITIPRQVFGNIGKFDENFGSGAFINSGGDTDFLYKAYLANYEIRYEPSLIVHHFHGRRSQLEARKLLRDYAGANGALILRYGLRYPKTLSAFMKRVVDTLKETIDGKNRGWADVNLTSQQILWFHISGMVKYLRLLSRR